MKFYYITFRSVTFAQRGEVMLKRMGIGCVLQRTPKILAERGCGYCLRIRDRDALAALTVLREQKVDYGKIYAIDEDGRAEERQV